MQDSHRISWDDTIIIAYIFCIVRNNSSSVWAQIEKVNSLHRLAATFSYLAKNSCKTPYTWERDFEISSSLMNKMILQDLIPARMPGRKMDMYCSNINVHIMESTCSAYHCIPAVWRLSFVCFSFSVRHVRCFPSNSFSSVAYKYISKVTIYTIVTYTLKGSKLCTLP